MFQGSFIKSTKIKHRDNYIEKRLWEQSLYNDSRNLYPGCTQNYVGCSDPFWSRCYYPQKHFYFSFPWMPNWIQDAVEEFNSKFNHIQISIFRNIEREVNIFSVLDGIKSSLSYRKYLGYLQDTIPDGELFTGKIPIFRTEFSSKYPIAFRVYANFLIHHYFRSFNIFEVFNNIKSTKDVLNSKDYSLEISPMDFVCKTNNLHKSSYRSLCENNIYSSDFLLLDDIDNINLLYDRYLKYHRYLRQTFLFTLMKGYKEFSKIKVGDWVRTDSYAGIYDGQHEWKLYTAKILIKKYQNHFGEWVETKDDREQNEFNLIKITEPCGGVE